MKLYFRFLKALEQFVHIFIAQIQSILPSSILGNHTHSFITSINFSFLLLLFWDSELISWDQKQNLVNNVFKIFHVLVTCLRRHWQWYDMIWYDKWYDMTVYIVSCSFIATLSSIVSYPALCKFWHRSSRWIVAFKVEFVRLSFLRIWKRFCLYLCPKRLSHPRFLRFLMC